MKLAAGLFLALLAAGALNIGFFVQHGAANAMLSLTLRHPVRSARMLLTSRQWMLGYATGWIGWGLYIAALALAPLSLVQAVSAGGVGVLAILVHRMGTPLQPRERLGAAIAVGGLVLVGVSLTVHLRPARAAHSSTLLWVVLVGVAVAGLLALVAARRVRPAMCLGSAAGLLFGVGDLATKGAVSGNGPLFIPVLAVCTALAFVALQLAFQRGRVLETAGLSTLVNNLIPIVGGLVVFHEALPHGVAGVARVAGFATVVAGAVLLAHAPEPPEHDPKSSTSPGVLDGSARG
ncbi:MAG TPA: hypothetical protein VG298_11615 [Acidimicrobiales bacterium]|jgi:hypothetical protein|nr:hypothetical protein [Acidimicrobiales bacterium]